MMNKTRALREQRLFRQALELTTEESRGAFLDQACGEDAALRRRINLLLEGHFQAEGFLTVPLRAFSPSPGAFPEVEGVGQTIGRYKLLEKLGEGGCGVVYVAEQTEPVRRRVALKVIKLGMDTRQVIARFQAERQALAMMDHPNIAKVLDAGTTGEAESQISNRKSQIPSGRPYFVMELVRGIRITDYCDQEKLGTKERLDLFIKVCQAIQHAHQKSIIHRDIKPSNILVTLHDGVPVPKVIDFGIAKATEGRLTDATVYTQLHQFIGTPAYMSPEQAEMSGLDVDTRSDIYSLGVLLYELLAGSTPFDAKELMASGIDAMRRTIREKEPVRPSTRLATLKGEELTTTAKRRSSEVPKLLHQLKGDLDWIVMKCLEKDRTRRYETANGLAADLKRHLNNEPVVARPPSTAYRFQKAWRRNKFAYSAVAAIVAALVVGLGVSVWQARVAAAARDSAAAAKEKALEAEAEKEIQRREAIDRADEAETQRLRAERVERIARHRAYAADMNLIQRSLEMHDLGSARRLLDRYRPAPGEEDLRGWEWRYLWQLCRSDAVARLRRPDANGLLAVSSSGDGRWIEFQPVNQTPSVPAYDWTRREAGRPAWAQTNSQMLMWSPRGMTAVALTGAGTNRVLQVVDSATGQVLNTLGPAPESVLQWRISADGGTLALIGLENGVARLSYWRLREGKGAYLDGIWVEASPIALPLAISPDGSLLAFRSISPSSLRVWDLRNHQELWTAGLDGGHMTTSAAFSPDGTRLFTGGGYAVGTIRVWSARTGEPTGSLEGHRFWVSSFAFADEGSTLVSGSADQTIRLWDLKTMGPIRVLQGHQSEVWSLLIHPSTGLLLSGGQNGETLAWDLSSPADAQVQLTLTNVSHWRFQENRPALTVVDLGSRTVTRRSGPGLGREEPLLALDGWDSIQISGSGNWAACTVSNNVQQIWSLNPPRLVDEWVGADARERCLGLSEQSRVLITFVPEKRLIRQWDLDSRKPVRSWPLPPSARHIELSPDGRQLLVLCNRMEESLWIHLETGEIHEARIPAGIYGRGFSPDGGLFGVATEPHVAHVWKVPSFEPFADLRGHMMGPKGIGFSADARRIATTGTGAQGVIFWDAEYQLELLTLPASGGLITSSAFSPDGRYYGASDGNILTVWTAPTFDEIAATEAKEKAEGWQP